MGSVASLWMALQPRQKAIAALALLAVVATIFGLVQAVRSPAMDTLYAGLDPRAAAEVSAAVEGMGVAVSVTGGTVQVPATDRDRVRMALAAAGLPRNGPEGYELLQGLDSFGTTSEMFAATYWRAKEGELARTILASPGVRSARVHIANPAGRPFQRGARPSASVTVTMSYGALDNAQAEAMRHLVASAVAGLDPDNVSVIDAANGAVLRAGEAASGGDAKMTGVAREAQLRGEIERLLAARVGDGKAIVTVAVETSHESENVVERRVDPSTRVAISTDTREIEDSGTGGGGGGSATVASNLPVDQGGGGGASSRSRTESEERVNYEVSETRREVTRKAGEIKRITVAVLVDGIATVNANGQRAWTPRPDTEIQQLRDLVRSAVGFDESRGDIVTVETLEFAERAEGGTVAEAGISRFFERNAVQMLQVVALAAVALGLMFFVLLPLLRAAEAQAQTVPERLPPSLEIGEVTDYGMNEPVDHLTLLRTAFAEQRDDSANVLRSWLERDVQERLAAEQEEA